MKDRNILYLEGIDIVEYDCLLEKLKSEIECKRDKLNRLIVSDVEKEEVLMFSVELDKLIGKYYNLKLNKKRAEKN